MVSHIPISEPVLKLAGFLLMSIMTLIIAFLVLIFLFVFAYALSHSLVHVALLGG